MLAKRPAMPEARTFTVTEDDDGIRLDRWFKRHLPDVSFNIVSRWSRTGQLRLNGEKASPGDRVEAGQEIRFPPPDEAPKRTARPQPKRDMAGVLERIGPFKWRLVIPWPQSTSKLDVFELTPVADQPK